MPLDSTQSTMSKTVKNKKSSIPRALSSIESDSHQIYHSSLYRTYYEGDSALPAFLKSRLHDLFLQIEKEFESVYAENITCKYKL